jgi:hypothetical protein
MKDYHVDIKEIIWIDRESKEAEVLFEISGNQLWAFCHPCKFIKGASEKVRFSFIEEETSELSFWNNNKERKKEVISSNNSRWSYYCYGKIVSIHPVTIDCGVIELPFGDWINDERTLGSYVYFVVSRLDIEKS